MMACTISTGTIKATVGQEKKHIEQMNPIEIMYLHKKIQSMNFRTLRKSRHLTEKNIEFRMEDIHKILDTKTYDIVEYNETTDYTGTTDHRVLVRSRRTVSVLFHDTNKNTSYLAQAHICFVLSFLTNEIITVYYNMSKDNHRHIDWYRYNKDLNIMKQ